MVSEHEWNTLDWLEEARSLLDWLSTLDSGPVLLMVRHSERLEDLDVSSTMGAELTDFGHKIALEFGRKLPKRWQTSITVHTSGLCKPRRKSRKAFRRVKAL